MIREREGANPSGFKGVVYLVIYVIFEFFVCFEFSFYTLVEVYDTNTFVPVSGLLADWLGD